jgi:VCBS repeat-containing protein
MRCRSPRRPSTRCRARTFGALHPDLYNGDFSVLDPVLAEYGWDSRGQAAIEAGSLVLREDDRAMSGLTQGFILPDGYVALRFTLKGAQFAANGATPPDAFEAALIDTATGQSAVGTGALSHTDSFFNLQSNGAAYASSAVRVTGLPASGNALLDTTSPITVTVNLSNVAAGSVLKLYFDLLGMGEQGSAITIDDVRLLTPADLNTAPVTVDDAVAVNEDNAVLIAPFTNDVDAEGDTLTARIVTGPAHGTLTPGADGTFTYTPDAHYFGPDGFTYVANDGEFDSNPATVNITITPVNDAPVLADVRDHRRSD